MKAKNPKTMARLITSLLSYLKNTAATTIQNKTGPGLLEEASSKTKQSFTALSPVDDADPDGKYAAALDWALKDRSNGDVKNIALTGPYGSGKSSILKTYQAKNTDPNLLFLNISLATFKEEVDKENPTKPTDLLRLIELSILQQIFYHEEDHKIPDSRFKKIRSFKTKVLISTTIGIFFVLVSIIHLYDKSFFETLTGYYPIPVVKTLWNLASFAIVLAGIFYTIFKSVRTISSITISKLNFQNAEIQISDSISKSILNNHLDEILYFFEVTSYTVVVIEDLDRFEQTEIFTKLRELNHLINYSEKIKREIVFIYAVRDDIFKDNDRTKFFDFIIPVIPVINSSNSNEKLLDIVNKNSYGIKPELIENISLFIDDLRLLYNIANEYHIYRQKLGNLNQDRLFSMMVYKNMYPDDFVDLSNGKGRLFSVFEKKEFFIRERTGQIESEIKEIHTKILDLERALITDKRELRMIYVYKYLENLPNITKFIVGEREYNYSEVITDEAFQFFIEDKLSYFHISLNVNYGNYRSNTSKVSIKFAEIESQINGEQTYSERLEIIEDLKNGHQDELKDKIRALETEKTRIRHFKIHEITALGGCKMEFENKRQSQLVNILLRNAYIGEDYLDYISIFYEGSITKSDREFLLNVKAQTKSEFDYKLTKISKLIPKIDAIDFNSENILNYSLLDYLLADDQYKQQRVAIFGILKNESSLSVGFIDGFLDQSENVNIFINQIAKQWPNIWHFLTQRSNYPKERLDLYLRLLLEHGDIDDIKAIANKSKLLTEISSMSNFLEFPISADKLKQIIAELKIKFTRLNFDQSPQDLANFVYKHNHYALAYETVKNIISHFGTYRKEDFDTRNFYAIKNSEAAHLIAYIDENIDIYITKIYLQIEQNTSEEETALISLLNHEKISVDLKGAIIARVETKVNDISSIHSFDIIRSLLNSSKSTPVWNNLLNYYQLADNLLDAYIVDFINEYDNAETLSKKKIDINKPEQELTMVRSFIKEMMLEDELSTECYELILKSIPYIYPALEFDDLSEEKVSLLVKNNKLSITTANYDLLRSNFDGMHMVLAEQKHAEFIPRLNEFLVGEPEVFYLLSSDQLTIQEKNIVIGYVGNELIRASSRLLALLGTASNNNEMLIVPDEVLIHVMLSPLALKEKLRLLIRNADKLSKEEIFQVLASMPGSYSEMATPGRRPTLDDNHLNRELTNKLVKMGIIKRASEEKGKIRISTYKQ